MRFTATGAWDWWRGLNPTRFVAAPMVDQSELAFRMLCRELGVGLCYTPMLHARLMTEHPSYKKLHFDAGGEDDRPLFGQLAGHDPQVVLSAARLIEDSVSAVDLNFGCPQAIARKGRYGAFLLEEPDVRAASLLDNQSGWQSHAGPRLRPVQEAERRDVRARAALEKDELALRVEHAHKAHHRHHARVLARRRREAEEP